VCERQGAIGLNDPEEHIARALDAVVGGRFAPPRRWRPTLLKWLAAALLALAMAALIAWILHSHVGAAQKAPGPPRPVSVQIVPAR
jgi:hypothetical protein